MEDNITRAMAKQAFDAVQGSLDIIESNYATNLNNLDNRLNSKIKQFTYTAASSGITNIVHNLGYNSINDDLLVFYQGILLTKNDNYIDNINNISIDLVGWSISTGETINFKLYKNVN